MKQLEVMEDSEVQIVVDGVRYELREIDTPFWRVIRKHPPFPFLQYRVVAEDVITHDYERFNVYEYQSIIIGGKMYCPYEDLT